MDIQTICQRREVFVIAAICPACKAGELVHVDGPNVQEHVCNKCGNRAQLSSKYPKIRNKVFNHEVQEQ